MKCRVRWNRWHNGQHVLAGSVLDLSEGEALALAAIAPGWLEALPEVEQEPRAPEAPPHDRMKRKGNKRG